MSFTGCEHPSGAEKFSQDLSATTPHETTNNQAESSLASVTNGWITRSACRTGAPPRTKTTAQTCPCFTSCASWSGFKLEQQCIGSSVNLLQFLDYVRGGERERDCCPPPPHRWERRGVGPGVYPLGELPLFFPAVLESHARRICPQVAPSVRVACAAIAVRQHREVCALRAPRSCGGPWCATIPDGIPPEP